MRAPMCYVLAVVLRIILFSVSMGFPINLKSTPARSASINRPNSRALVGRPHHTGDLTLFSGQTRSLSLTFGRVAGLATEVNTVPDTTLGSPSHPPAQFCGIPMHSLAVAFSRSAACQGLTCAALSEAALVSTPAGIRASAISGEVVQAVSTPWAPSENPEETLGGQGLMHAIQHVLDQCCAAFKGSGIFLKDIFILSKVAPSVRARVAVTGIREPGTPAVRTNTSYSSPRSSSCTAPAPGRAGGGVTTALPSPRWPVPPPPASGSRSVTSSADGRVAPEAASRALRPAELATHHRADFDGSLMEFVVRRSTFTGFTVALERLALGLVLGLGMRAGGVAT